MKKHIALILTVVLMLNLCPINSGADDVSTAAKDNKPVLFYMADDYEEQRIGDYANGLWHYLDAAEGLARGAVVPKNDNPENIAVEYTSEATGTEQENMIAFYYAPIAYDFVFDFMFNTGTADKISIGIGKDATSAAKVLVDVSKAVNVIELSSMVKVNGSILKLYIQKGEWHRFQMKVNMETKKADVYIDGSYVGKSVDFPIENNITSFRFLSPELKSGQATKYYIDDIYLYLSDEILSDEERDSDLEEYERSGLRPNPRYQSGFASHYYQYVFDMFYNEFVMSPYGRRVWKDNQFYDFPTNCMIEDEKILVPFGAFSEMMGATVNYDNGRITVSKGERTMTVIEDSEVYYIDGNPLLLSEPVKIHKGYAMFDLDVLCQFFEIEYERFENMRPTGVESYDLISFSGDFNCDYEILGDSDAESWSGNGRTMYYECLIRMNEMLYVDIPTKEEIRELLDSKYETEQHPRLVINDFQKLKDDLNRGDTGYNGKVASFIATADSYLDTDSFNETTWDGESIYSHMVSTAFAWNMTGKSKYLDFITENIDELYIYVTETYTGNVKKNLDSLWVGNGMIGLGITYDWMYNTLNESDKARLEKLHKIIEILGVEFHDKAFRSPVQCEISGSEYGYGNQTLLKNAGSIASCAAIYEYDPDLCAGLMAANIRSISNPFAEFAPNGEWGEGVPYWTYVCGKMPVAIEIFETFFGTHFGLYDIPGVSNTSEFGMSYVGATGTAYANGDGEAKVPSLSVGAKEAKYNNDIAKLLKYRASNPAVTLTDITNWWFLTPEELENYGDATVEYDAYMERLENVLLKSGSDTSDTSVAIHGGGVNDAHGHEDNGTIQFDMIGYRWANEVGREHYNVPAFGDYVGRTEENPTRPYTGWKGHEYYRNGAEGHNTVFADLGGPYTGRYHMTTDAKSNFIKTGFSDTLSFALLDMTSTNPIYESAIRGVKLDKIQNEIIIHDHFQAKEATDFHWGMHTEADVEVAEDGRSAVLSTDDGAKRIWIGIISDGDYVIKDLPARPYEGILKAADIAPGDLMRPAGYEDVMLRPPFESPVDVPFEQFESASGVEKGFRRLTIETEEDTKDFNLMVAIKPLSDGEDTPSVMPVAQPMETWSNLTAEMTREGESSYKITFSNNLLSPTDAENYVDLFDSEGNKVTTGVTKSSGDNYVMLTLDKSQIDNILDCSIKITENIILDEYLQKYEGGTFAFSDFRVRGVALDKSAVEIDIDTTHTLVATVFPEDAIDKSVIWSSSDNTIATVDQNGVVKGLKEGDAIITATTVDGGIIDSCLVMVGKLKVTGITSDDKVQKGDTVVLGVDTEIAADNIDYICFYANDEKIPGSLIDVNLKLTWNASVAGKYSITAKAILKDGREKTSLPVEFEVTDSNILKLIEFTPECDKVTYSGNPTTTEFTTEKVRVGKYSWHYVGTAASVQKYFQYNLTVQYGGYKWNDEDYLKMWVYNAGDECTLRYMPTLSNGAMPTKPDIQLNQGWNLVSIRLGGELYPDYGFNIYDNIILDGYSCGGTDGKNLDLYFGEPWIEKTDTYDTLTATPSVEDGATSVSTQLEEYTINFSNPLNDPEKAAAAVTLKQGENEVEKAVITGGTNFVKIVPGTLLPQTTYTVSIADEAIFDITGNEPKTKSFTFTTADADFVETPVPTILYPVSGSTVANTTRITVGVKAGSNVASVKIFDNLNELGESGIEAVKRVGDEWQVDTATFTTAGEHTITAKLYDANGEELATTDGTFTTFAVGPFNVSGIYEGAYHAMNENITVKVTTSSAANDISKVVFVDGETETPDTEAPYEWSLPNNPGAHTLKVYVHDIYGGKTLAKTINYTTFMGNPIATVSQDFEGVAPTIITDTAIDIHSIVDCANLDGKALKVTGAVDYMFIDPGTQIGWNGDIKVVYYEFDVYQPTATGGTILKFGYPGYAHRHGSAGLISDGLAGKRTHVRIIYDLVNKKYSVYQGDTIISEGTAFSGNMGGWNDTDKKDVAYSFRSNGYTADRPVYFDNFKTTAYSEVGAGEVAAAWNNPTIIENNQATSIPTSMSVVNNTGSLLKLINIFAEYTQAGVLVNAYVNEFDAPTGQKTESEYVMTGLTAGNTVKMYTLNAETLEPYTILTK